MNLNVYKGSGICKHLLFCVDKAKKRRRENSFFFLHQSAGRTYFEIYKEIHNIYVQLCVIINESMNVGKQYNSGLYRIKDGHSNGRPKYQSLK